MSIFPTVNGVYPDINAKKIDEYFGQYLSNENEVMNDINAKCIYFICFTNRCGSNYVAQAMSSDQHLKQAGENLNFDTVINLSSKNNFSSFQQYFNWLVKKDKGMIDIFGCKASAGQLIYLYNQGILHKIKNKIKFIHIIREDLLDQAVSLLIADQTNKWTSNQTGNNNNIEYDGQKLIQIMNGINLQNSMFNVFFQTLNIKPLVIKYGNFVDNPEQYIKDIGLYLGIENLQYVQQNIKYQKQADEINNEIKEKFKNDYKLF
ncbi:MAG: Stf0 family sulfotransferase [Phycisphaerae bacterium]|nr:Stf0 family sulfotransferase [Phycisphaerae bacterium]